MASVDLLGDLRRPSAPAFLLLFSLDSMARAMLITVVPLHAYAILADAQKVSVLYFGASTVGLFGALSVPWWVGRLRRRWTLALGSACLLGAVVLLSRQHIAAFTVGLILQMLGGAALTICLNLYVLDNIPKADLTRFEPVRMLFAGIGWMTGPVLGVFLATRIAPWSPYVLSGGLSLALILYFWTLRGPRAVAGSATAAPPQTNPLRFIRRFSVQPRLVLAWLLSVGRAAWWNMFYIYAPIYAVATGLGEEAGGIIASVGSAGLFTVTFWGWVGRRKGIRWLLVFGYVVTGFFSVLVGGAMALPMVGAVLLVAAAFAASITDGAGNVPFLRSVRARERAEMTSVYATYRESARLSMPALYSVLLLVFPLPAVFVASGGLMFLLAHYARYLPRSFGLDRRGRAQQA